MRLPPPKLPRGVQIVEVESMSLVEKDVMFLKNFEDFKFLLGDSITVYRLNNLLYALSSSVTFVYDMAPGKKKKGD